MDSINLIKKNPQIIELFNTHGGSQVYGNNLRGQALKAGLTQAFDYPGFVPAYIRPMFCVGRGPFRWLALTGNPEDIIKTDNIMEPRKPIAIDISAYAAANRIIAIRNR